MVVFVVFGGFGSGAVDDGIAGLPLQPKPVRPRQPRLVTRVPVHRREFNKQKRKLELIEATRPSINHGRQYLRCPID